MFKHKCYLPSLAFMSAVLLGSPAWAGVPTTGSTGSISSITKEPFSVKEGALTDYEYTRLCAIQTRIVEKHLIADSALKWGLDELAKPPPVDTKNNYTFHFVMSLSSLGAYGVRYTPSQKAALLGVLVRYLHTKDASIEAVVADTLALVGGARALGYLEYLQKSPDPIMRNQATYALVNIFPGPNRIP